MSGSLSKTSAFSWPFRGIAPVPQAAFGSTSTLAKFQAANPLKRFDGALFHRLPDNSFPLQVAQVLLIFLPFVVGGIDDGEHSRLGDAIARFPIPCFVNALFDDFRSGYPECL